MILISGTPALSIEGVNRHSRKNDSRIRPMTIGKGEGGNGRDQQEYLNDETNLLLE
jgi:hypothetical protein